MAALLQTAMDAGRVGPVDLGARRRLVGSTGALADRRRRRARRPARRARRSVGRGVVEIVPGLLHLDDPYPVMEDLARRCGARGLPAHVDRVHLQPEQPGRHPAVGRHGHPARRRGHLVPAPAVTAARRHAPQLGLLDDVHVDARRLAPGDRRPRSRRQGARCCRTRSGGPPPARSGTAPSGRCSPTAAPRSCASSRWSVPRTSSGSGATFADLLAVSDGHPSDVLADFVLANDCHPGFVAQGLANADVEGVARTLADPAVLDQLLRRRGPLADAVRVGRQHAAAHPPRARARRPHPRAGRARAHRPSGRGVRLPRPGRGRARGDRRSRRVRARRAALRRRRLRRRPARRRVAPAPPRGRLPGDDRRRHARCSSTGSSPATCPVG